MYIVNPILTGFNPDPSICRVGDDYYIATSTFEWFPGVQIHHSKDLKHWQLITRPLNRLSQLNMHGNPDSGGVWAPALSYSDGKFWLIYSDMKVVSGAYKDGHNYLTTCDTIDGEWADPIYLNSAGFDPSLYHDEDGRKYLLNMVWDQRVNNHSFSGIHLQEYCTKENKLIGKPVNIFKGTDLKLTEAPHLYKKDGYYYLLTAEGGTSYNHAVTVCRSKHLTGPYEVSPGNPLVTAAHTAPRTHLQKSGHGSFVHTHTDQWFMVYLVGRPIVGNPDATGGTGRNTEVAQSSTSAHRGYCPLGRETAIEKILWAWDWPTIAGDNTPNLTIEGPQMEEVKWEQNYDNMDHFDKTDLNIHFQTLRIPLGEDIVTLKERPGFLRLYGRESLTSTFTQALVARRWQHFSFEAGTYVEFNPTTFQQQAGLVNYYNTMNWTSLHITWNEDLGRVLNVMTAENGVFAEPIASELIVVPKEVVGVHLKVVVQKETYHYLYSFDGDVWQKVPVVFESYKLSDDFVTGGGFFTGAFVGIHCSDTSGQRLHGDFDYFMYEEEKRSWM